MSHVIQFHPDLVKQLNQQVALAKRIWREAAPTLLGLRIAAGNYAGYGSYRARCHPSGIIEFPIGNASSLLDFEDNQLIHAHADKRHLLGVLLHEIGHHVVNTAQNQPWRDNIQVGPSTHYTAAWVWICCTGWNYISRTSLDPNEFARTVKQNKDEMRIWLQDYNPYFPPPPTTSPAIECTNCGISFEPKRSDSKYCSSNCRVTAFRVRNG